MNNPAPKQTLSAATVPPFRVVLAGGGTGGHLIPAVALAQEFKRLLPECDVRFLIPGKQLERDILTSHAMPFDTCGGMSPSGGLRAKVRGSLSLASAYRTCLARLRLSMPDCVIGVGGYGSVCAGMAARRLGIPIMLLEQNVLAGRVNRLMSRFAETVYAQWPLMRKLPGRAKVEVVGNPVRRSIGRFDRALALSLLDLDPARRTLLVMGGSQGAGAINRFMTTNLVNMEAWASQFQVIHLTGSGEFESVQAQWAHSRIKRRVLPFANDMGPLIAACDAVLCRAGATTIAELTAFGKPMFLVPLPTAKDNHQALNARYVEAAGAAVVIEQQSLEQPAALERVVGTMLNGAGELSRLSDGARSLGRPEAGKRIALAILERFAIQPSAQTAEKFESQRASSISGRAA